MNTKNSNLNHLKRIVNNSIRTITVLQVGMKRKKDSNSLLNLLIFVSSGRYSHMTLGVGHVGIFMGATSHF
jgi:hypothetical protein